ncbi:hypothetical protein [Pseudoduganella namucuonensis]|uniref:hypothetical protein n=1 Tax=Pseudoduganella namucuonensis TaxID=1035707 RepID=UPI000B868CF7|nr:hypothetical protein [Pseudoduganella namucuonensis]
MPSNSTESSELQQLAEALEAMADPARPHGPRAEELRLLYTQRHEWARHYNGLIWSITAILLPVALGGLVLPFRNDDGDLHKAALISAAVGSSLLLIFWNVICDSQRQLWEREFRIISIIEGVWSARTMPQDSSEYGRHLLSSKKSGYIKRMRNGIAVLGVIIWIVRVLAELHAT